MLKKCLILFFLVPVLGYAEKLNDNSFLIEEGYNQKESVIQHILNSSESDIESFSFSFTEEWPLFGQTHQLSFTVNWGDYIGDLLLNYRYQLILNDKIAFAPRVSLLLPTADEKFSYGAPRWGIESNLPLNIDIAERIALSFNAGAGLRFGIDMNKDFQIVPGIGVYRNFNLDENFIFIYLSFCGA